jgi:hypothetical protein
MRATTTNPALSPSPREQEVEWGSRTVDVYEKIEQIGEGTYGYVFLLFSPLSWPDFSFTSEPSDKCIKHVISSLAKLLH